MTCGSAVSRGNCHAIQCARLVISAALDRYATEGDIQNLNRER
jgi:hypothetical protein